MRQAEQRAIRTRRPHGAQRQCALAKVRALTATALVGLLATFACSLHSLDYLESGGDPSVQGGESGVANGGATSMAGAPSAAAPSTGGARPVGGAPSEESAGAAGALPEPELPDCGDSLVTADETDEDCGGRTCDPCAPGKRCLNGTDCDSAICTNQVCQKPTCLDLAVNGDEADLNCGGSCAGCALGMHCRTAADCASGVCQQAVCVSPTCVEDELSDACPLLVDNTPYSLSPAEALSKCIDDNGQSVADGNGMILYTCKLELHQTFWAVTQADGYFAFRNALSGKCLQVHGSSMVSGAAVEQGACDYAPAQLWKPSRVDNLFMQLTSKLSTLSLDVAGEPSDYQPIVQSKVTSNMGVRWRVLKRASAAYMQLAPNDGKDLSVRHDGRDVTLAPDDEASAHWKVVPGLADASFVSFQSRDEPGRFLRHASFRLWADLNDGSALFAYDATFRPARPFESAWPAWALESLNYSGRFWLHNGDVIALAKQETSSAFNGGATWLITPR